VNKYLLAYDPQPDAIYIRMPHKKIFRTVEIDGTTMVDLDKGNHIVGTEILDFSGAKVDISQLITKQMGGLDDVTK